jgi:hypothetical protein
MRKLVYIKVFKGYLEARTVGENNEKQFPSEGLTHPRSLAGKFSDVEDAFKRAVASQPKTLFGLIKPKLLIQLVPKMEGGYTELELRFFREAAAASGVSQIFLLDDQYGPLSDGELLITFK